MSTPLSNLPLGPLAWRGLDAAGADPQAAATQPSAQTPAWFGVDGGHAVLDLPAAPAAADVAAFSARFLDCLLTPAQ